jgi:hypothetical protein
MLFIEIRLTLTLSMLGILIADDVSALSNSTRTSKAQRIASEQVNELAIQYAGTFEAQRKQIEELRQQVASLGTVTSAQSTPVKMPDNQTAPVTISKPPQVAYGDGNSDNSDSSPTERNEWREDDEDQRNEWNSPPATTNDDAMEGTLGNQDDNLESLSDTDDSEDNSTRGVTYIKSIAAPLVAKRHIPESSSDDESSDDEEEAELVDNAQLKIHDKANLPITSHRATRSSKR